MPYVTVNGTEIYYEIRGSGPPLVFVSGAFSDVSHFTRVAELLAGDFTTITYDRRGNSRSGGLEAGEPTGPNEQADDTAALLEALSMTPAHVYGNSSGAIMALCLLVRHPDVVRAAILHEPPLNAGLAHPEEVQAIVGEVVDSGMVAAGVPGASEAFLRFAMGEKNWEALDADAQEQAKKNGNTFFGSELGNFEPYLPDDTAFDEVAVPVAVLISDDGPPLFKEIGPWLAARLGVEVTTTPGTHTPHLDHPVELAGYIRSFLHNNLLKA